MLIVAPIALVVAAGAWWSVGRGAESDVATSVSGTAVVVSSLACANGDEGTVVDVAGPGLGGSEPAHRAILDSCGHQVGEQLAVDYTDGDPGRVTLAAVDTSDDDGTQLLPLGVVLAASLGVAAAVAVVRDGRRRRESDPDAVRAAGGRHARPDDDEPPAEQVIVPDFPPEPPPGLDRLLGPRDELATHLHDELFTHRSPAGV